MSTSRRNFVRSLGAPALLPAALHAQSALARSTRGRVELNGAWERYIDGKLIDVVEVPSSLRLSGYYQLRRQTTLPRLGPNERAVLRFEAIALYGRAAINGVNLGELDPYVPFEFDVTSHVREGANTVEIAIADLAPGPNDAGKDAIEIGINPGWEAYGGIIRDTYIELRPAAFVDNVRFAYTLDRGLGHARCSAQVFTRSSVSRRLEIRGFPLPQIQQSRRRHNESESPTGRWRDGTCV